jgi:putative transcriptional regulator
MRSGSQPEGSLHIFEDVYISANRTVLQQTIDNADSEENFRVFAGHAGWAPGQLDREVSRGSWHIMEADAKIVFDKPPSEIWPELIRQSSVLWVRLKQVQ